MCSIACLIGDSSQIQLLPVLFGGVLIGVECLRVYFLLVRMFAYWAAERRYGKLPVFEIVMVFGFKGERECRKSSVAHSIDSAPIVDMRLVRLAWGYLSKFFISLAQESPELPFPQVSAEVAFLESQRETNELVRWVLMIFIVQFFSCRICARS